MTRKILYILIILMSGLNVYAQRQSAFHIGFYGAQKQVNLSPDDSAMFFINSGRQVISGAGTVVLDEKNGLFGFPYPVKYFAQTFNKDFFVSKGFFPDVVQLNWQVEGKAERVQRFLLYRKPLGSEGDSLLVATLGPEEFSFRDEFVEGGVLYKYTLYAEGISDELRLPYINYIEGTGFAFPVGTATGRVTYEGGTAVEGVTILAETDGNLRGRSIYLNGEDAYMRVTPQRKDEELKLDNGFSLQFWTRFAGEGRSTLFNRGSDVNLDYDGDSLYFEVAGTQANLEFINPVDSFFHVTAVYNAQESYIALYARVNDKSVASVQVSTVGTPSTQIDHFFFGRGQQGSFYHGYLDEMRLWDKALTYEESADNYSRYLAGSEDDFAAYWRLDAGIAQGFYDFSRQGGFDFNENHGQLLRGEWSEVTPLNSQLAYRGVTDASGNYTITGFPFETKGSLYTFTPMYENHTFEPNQQLRYVGDGEFIFNEVDFDDISSFPVSGTVRYRNSRFPVQGVSILVDGRPAMNRDGELILTDRMGQFTIDVPIGDHSLRMDMNEHEFADEGRFPPTEEDDPMPLYNFQQPLAGLEFIDNSLVKVAGRVVGGAVEEAKPLGFGQSNNNLGALEIGLEPEKGFDLTWDTTNDSTQVYEERHINGSATFDGKFVTINPDPETGEYVAYLPPEKYKINYVKTGNYPQDDAFLVTMDLLQNVDNEEVLEDTVGARVDGELLPEYPPVDSSRYSHFYEVEKGDTLFTVAVDSFEYQHKQNFIYRVRPNIVITNEEDGDYFGDDVFVYEQLETGEQTEIDLQKPDGGYAFGHPVFTQRQEYLMYISLFEEYENSISGEIDRVPVTDGYLEIRNNLAVNTNLETLELNTRGKAFYAFQGGLPNTEVDPLVPENSFTKTLNITAFSGNDGAIKTTWREGNPFRGYIFGGLPTGNNFVTSGPTKIDMILRDPPGGGSMVYMESGESLTTTTTYSVTAGLAKEKTHNLQVGATVETFAGVGAGKITEVSVTNNTEVGMAYEANYEFGNEVTSTLTTTRTWSSSDDPLFTGSDGDVFIGHATNIVYGKSFFIEPIPVSNCTTCAEESHEGFKVGLNEGLRLNPEFATSFIFTQFHIESYLLSNLEQVRNSFLIYTENPESVVATDKPVYVSRVPPSDERYGTKNNNEEVWKDLASDYNSNGPSYFVVYPEDYEDTSEDTILYFNNQIQGWKFWLNHNERMKVQAKLDKNLSFDGGVSYEESVETSISEDISQTFDFNVSNAITNELGLEVDDKGYTKTMTLNMSVGGGAGRSETTENTTTYGFVLSDGDAGDAYTVDVKTPDDGFGPVFSTKGGATSCPYEGEEVTQYYQPGRYTLHQATMRREMPALDVEEAVVADVPETRAAEFTLKLSNMTETEDDFWYDLALVSGSNPFGASLVVDGNALTDGQQILVPAGETITKTVMVYKGQADVLDYENLQIVLRSQCQSDPTDNLAVLADTVSLSAYFLPSCSELKVTAPKPQWVMNTNIRPQDTLGLTIEGYDLNYDNFKYIQFQYKPSSTSTWTTNMFFYNPREVSEEEFAQLDEPKAWIDGPQVQYMWDMHSLPDREYDVRAIAVCELGPGMLVNTPDDAVSGLKDVKRPRVFGSPQPADDVLSAGDEIMIQFDEEIEAGLLTPFNFSVQGVLNNYEINHNTSISLDGINDYVKVENGVRLTNRSFTIEFWLQRSEYGKEQVIYSQGNLAEDALRIGFTAADRVFIDWAGQRITTNEKVSSDNWLHYSLVYDHNRQKLNMYQGENYLLENVNVQRTFPGEGVINIGRDVVNNDRYLSANVHELRIWTRALKISDIYAQMNQSLTGAEVGLIGYWPMDEAFGKRAFDKARYRHATLFADWLVLPRGSAFAFDGTDDYLEMNTGSTVVIRPEMDYTIEFWFKASPNQTNAVMFSSGKGDGQDVFNDYNLSIGFNELGQLTVIHNGNRIQHASQEVDFRDDNWHHLAFAVHRLGNANLFVDSELLASAPGANFAGLAGGRMHLGARVYKTGNISRTQDQFFRGKLDEVRIWKLAKRQTQVNLNMTAKLSGDEMGLVAYYPFETYNTVMGVKIMNPTLSDQWNNPYGSNAGLATAMGGADHSDDAPNVRDSRPVQKIDFDFVVNKDKIIITPAASMEGLIEKTVLEITIDGIQDKYENRLASPVSWTAFINKNQVKWGEVELQLEKQVYQPMQFEVEVFNHGGAQQNFSLKNLPMWLQASPASGVLDPLSSQKVTFTVNEGLNTGYYSEDVYLSSDFDFDEKLSIDIRVFSEEPEWVVDPFAFQYSMNVVADLEIDRIISRDQYDKVAAFVDGECRGVAHLEYVEAFDRYEAFLDIYSNQEAGDIIELRVWDASTGTEYRDVQPVYVFLANSVKGRPSNPENIKTSNTIVQHIDLATGWNWVSLGLTSSNLSNVNGIMQGLNNNNGDQIKSQTQLDVYNETYGWNGSLTHGGGFENGKMYMMKISEPGRISLIGQQADLAQTISLQEGWNWLGYLPKFNMTVNEAFSGMNPSSGDIVKSKLAFAMYEEGLGWSGSLRYLSPGEGYLYQAAEALGLKYPKVSLLNGRIQKEQLDTEDLPWAVSEHKYAENMTMIAALDGLDASKYVLGAFVGDECRGAVRAVQASKNGWLYFVTVQGEERLLPQDIHFRLYDTEQGESMALSSSLPFASNAHFGTLSEPYLLGLDEQTTPQSEEVRAVPNPFGEQVSIYLPIDLRESPEIIIQDVRGREVIRLQQDVDSPEIVVWDGHHASGQPLPKGVYLVLIKSGERTATLKLIKK